MTIFPASPSPWPNLESIPVLEILRGSAPTLSDVRMVHQLSKISHVVHTESFSHYPLFPRMCAMDYRELRYENHVVSDRDATLLNGIARPSRLNLGATCR